MAPWLGMLLILQGDAARLPPPSPSSSAARATLAAQPPVLDGRDEDAVWRSAPVIDQFLQAKPSEGAPARFKTEARVAYDARTLYVFVRAFDPRPDSIVGQLARRDEQPPSDEIIVLLDSYHDRRTGYEFVVNPAGVKADYAIYNDGDEDVAWDAVWDVATRIDSLGWTAEYEIPLSQVRYAGKANVTFGLLIWRTIHRHTETVTWPLYRPSRSGFTSQFGEVNGLEGLASPGHAEITPYVLTQNVTGPASTDYARDQEVSVGGDLKYRLLSNLLLNATVNPDFGQVEADPSELNLGAFETFFEERRPFFVEGKGLFTFNVNCVVVVDCDTGEGLFYSRRIGRSPQLADIYGDESSATATRIISAAKVTGRMPGGFSLGVLDAITDDVAGPDGTTLEPTTNYAVVRGNQDFDAGNSSFGFIATAVNRSLDEWTGPYLHQSAYTGGGDARRRSGRFEVSGSFDVSRVAGSEKAIAATQQDAVHLYQRPDGPLVFDSTRTSLSGSNLELRFAKVGGNRLRFETAYQRRTPGFEINDVGFLRQADQQAWTSWATLMFRKPNRVFRELRWNFNNWEYWSVAGLPTEVAFNTNVHTQFNNRWWGYHMGGTLGQLGTTYCDRCARGGPAIRQDVYVAPWLGIEGDNRKPLIPTLWVNYWYGDGGRSETISLEPTLELKVSTRFTTSLGARWENNRNDIQYYGTFAGPAGGLHYTFAHLQQETLSLTWRLGYTFTPNTSLQIYASPFISKGTYTNVREVGDARAADYDARYQPYGDPEVATDPGGFNVQEFRSNVVFRWEYRPGSTLFLVWSQGREGSAEEEGSNSFRGDLSNLFDQHADNTFLLKVSYWFSR